MVIQHPLYEHLEYAGDHNILTAKDTVLAKADFFIRLQIKGASNEIKIVETLKNKAKQEELISIKL